MQPTFETFDHTADMGIRVYAPTREELVAPAGEGLYAAIGELVASAAATSFSIELADDDPAILLRDYLTELLMLFETDQRIVTTLDAVSFTDRALVVSAQTACVDSKRSVYCREVKAVTYHELDLRSIPGGYQATFIVDI